MTATTTISSRSTTAPVRCWLLAQGNIFYNQTGSDEHIDVNSATDVTIQDNIFFSDFAGSGRTNSNDTSSYIVIKDSNGSDDANLGSQRITLRRNIFLNWEGSTGSYFVLVGDAAGAVNKNVTLIKYGTGGGGGGGGMGMTCWLRTT